VADSYNHEIRNGVPADLKITCTDGKTIVANGSSDTYTITVTNTGLQSESSFKPPRSPVPILAEPSAVKKIKWFRKIFGNFIPNFREWVAKTKNYKLKIKPEHV